MADTWMDSNYINYLYDHFEKNSKNRNVISNLYRDKARILRPQLVKAKADLKAVQAQFKGKTPDESTEDFIARMLTPGVQNNTMQEALSALSETQPLVGTKISGIEATRSAGYGVTYNNLPTVLRETSQLGKKWVDVASVLTENVETIFNSIAERTGLSDSLKRRVLARLASHKPITPAQRRLIATELLGYKAVSGKNAEDYAKVEAAIDSLDKASREIGRLSGSWTNNKDASNIGKLIKSAVSSIQAPMAEASVAYLGARALAHSGEKQVGRILTEVEGAVRAPTKYSPELVKIAKDSKDFLKLSSTPVQQKGDVRFWAEGDYTHGEFLVNVKTASPTTLYSSSANGYIPGITFLGGTNLLALFDKVGAFSQSNGVLNAAMNAAVGNPISDSNAEQDWNKMREILANMALLTALTGKGLHQENSKVVMVIINERVFFVTEIIEKLIEATQDLNSHGDAVHLTDWPGRYVYSGINEFKGTRKSRPDARDRSSEANLNLIRTWQRQTVSIKLTQLGNLLDI